MTDATAASQPDDAQQQIAALQQQLDLMREQQEMLLYTLSHDLRTPVMTILGFTDMLITDLKEVSEDAAARQYLEHIRNSASRQASLIESLLQLSRLSRQIVHPEPLDLTRIAFDYWQAQSEQSNVNHIAIKLLPTPGVIGDKPLLTLLVHILLDNAIKFTSKQAHPEICFGAEQQDGQPIYYLRDNGVGFNSQRAERLFQPFRRLHSSKDFEGLGTGLATASLISQRHHGRIWAESSVDQGTTIRFTLSNL